MRSSEPRYRYTAAVVPSCAAKFEDDLRQADCARWFRLDATDQSGADIYVYVMDAPRDDNPRLRLRHIGPDWFTVHEIDWERGHA
jgi:hypothetical protein